MKEAIRTDAAGLFLEPVLVDNSMSGVFPIYEDVWQDEDAEPVNVLVGYTVAIPVPQGLYMPITFNVGAYEAADKEQEDYNPSSFWAGSEAPEPVISPPTEVELLTERIAAMEEESTFTQLALTSTYEELLASQEETTNAQLALVDVYELALSLQEEVTELRKQLEVK